MNLDLLSVHKNGLQNEDYAFFLAKSPQISTSTALIGPICHLYLLILLNEAILHLLALNAPQTEENYI